MPRLSRIFLRDLQLDGFICFVECAEKRRSWLTHLEINRAILDLQNDVCVELPVEFVEIVVGRAGSVVFQIAPIEMMVVDKPAIKKQTAVWFECASNKVRAIRVRSAIRRWADPAFGISLQHKAAEIRNRCVDFVRFLSPPLRHPRIEWIECCEPADGFGA